MDTTSPIKTWMQRLSPTKLRTDKPLPPAPTAVDSDNLQPPALPLKSKSANASPSKPAGISSSKRLSLFSSKPVRASPPRVSPRPIRKQFSFSTLRKTATSAKHKFKSRQKSPDLRRLSRKLSDLEAQLQKTKREIRLRVPRSNSVEREQAADAEKERRRRDKPDTSEGPYGGLVENLLHNSQRDRQHITRSLTSKSADDLSAFQQQAYLEDDEDEEREYENPRPLSPDSLKRKRSELRQESWGRIQQQLQEKIVRSGRDGGDQHQAKRPRRAVSQDSSSVLVRDNKELPVLNRHQRSVSDNASKPLQDSGINARPVTRRGPDSIRINMAKDLPAPPPLGLSEIPRFEPPTAEDDEEDTANWTVFPTPEEENRNARLLHQRHHSLPEEALAGATPSPKKSRHRRQRSLVIAKDEVEVIVREQEQRKQVERRKSGGGGGGPGRRPRKRLPASPTRSACPSPSRLEPVEEEFEWPEDVF